MKAAIYARYSTDEQRPESIADQSETCRRYCAVKGWTVIGTYADAAMSGSSSFRPEFERLKRDAELKHFDIVVVEALDQLSRRLAMSLLSTMFFRSADRSCMPATRARFRRCSPASSAPSRKDFWKI